jgi:N-methylhydantoinase A
LVLGRLDQDYFAGGEISLDLQSAREAIDEHCAAPLGLSIEESAHGIVEIANTAMVNALRLVSVQRGHDPRDFALIGFGGAGPAHAVRLAEQAGIPRVLVPLGPGTASALGLLVTDVRMEGSATLIVRSDEVDPDQVANLFKRLEDSGREAHRVATSASGDPVFERTVEMRYWGQSFELSVPGPDRENVDQSWLNELVESFHEAHESAYGFRANDEPVELVNLRMTTVGKIARPEMHRLENRVSGEVNAFSAAKGERSVYFAESEGFVRSTVYDRQRLPAGAVFAGPAIVEEPDSTTVIHPGWNVNVDDFGNLSIEQPSANPSTN